MERDMGKKRMKYHL